MNKIKEKSLKKKEKEGFPLFRTPPSNNLFNKHDSSTKALHMAQSTYIKFKNNTSHQNKKENNKT